MVAHEYYRNETLVKQRNIQNWPDGTVLRIAKRKNIGSKFWPEYKYFVTAVGAKPGFGCWLKHNQVQPLSALELLAAQAHE